MSAKARHYHTSDPGWQIRIRNYLRAGFGVEDISVKFKEAGITPNELHHIRRYVSLMREVGVLKSVLRVGEKRDEKHISPQ